MPPPTSASAALALRKLVRLANGPLVPRDDPAARAVLLLLVLRTAVAPPSRVAAGAGAALDAVGAERRLVAEHAPPLAPPALRGRGMLWPRSLAFACWAMRILALISVSCA